MKLRQTSIIVHVLGAAAASAIAAYWALKLVAAPASPVAPVAGPRLAMRDPDARLAARMFGDVNSGPAAVVRNVQVSGVYAAGAASSAVIVVDGKPPRAVLLSQEVAPGLRLVEVRPDGITLDDNGARTDYAVPPVTIARASSPAPQFRREGNSLTAPMLDPAVSGRSPSGGGPGRFPGSVAPTPPSGMLLQRGGADDPNGRPNPPAVPPPPMPGSPAGG